ncbi:MAG: 1,6-anhydro-N-acetylmuramyl-L-alanine amidase AmpD [Rhodocyclaceae bacterium]|nr:1,6-anhydro-N-acetylmuramyl-L-alanine amidase AmpD [Rhodocyclaceae bacterium]
MTSSSDAAWRIDADGWLTGCERCVSPNQDDRPAGETICLVVLHAISLPPGEFGGDAVRAFFMNRLPVDAHPYYTSLAGLRVSAHFFIARSGAIVQFVSCRARAWHAGVSCWRGRERCNDYSLGVELEGDDWHAFTSQQYDTLTRLLGALRAAYPIEAVVGHLDVAPGRKTDPGPYFDWSRIIA